MNSTADVATAEGWFASQDGTPAIFFTSVCPAGPGTLLHYVSVSVSLWRVGARNFLHVLRVGGRNQVPLSLPVFFRDGLIDIGQAKQKRRGDRSAPETGNYTARWIFSAGRKTGQFIIPAGGISLPNAVGLQRSWYVRDANSSNAHWFRFR